MKLLRFCILVVLLNLPNIILSQNEYYDALFLIKHSSYDSHSNIVTLTPVNHHSDSVKFYSQRDSIISVLNKYFPNIDVNTDAKNFAGKIGDNPFFYNHISYNGVLLGKSPAPILKNLFSSGANAIGAIDVTNFADGLAKFLVERVKQELSISFFEKFKRDLDSNEQLKIVFPSTYFALGVIDKEIYNYSAYLGLLRESFQKDLTLFFPHIGKLINDKCMNEVFSNSQIVRTMLCDAFYIANEFSEGKFPGEILHNYTTNQANESSLRNVNSYLYPSLKTLDLFSQSLRSRQNDTYWINDESLKLLINDTITFRIYLGLIYQRSLVSQIHFTDKISFNSILRKYAGNMNALTLLYKPYLEGLIERGRSVNSYYNLIKEDQRKGKDKPTYQDYISLYDATINLMEFLSQSPFLDKFLSEDSKARTNLEDYFNSARSLGNIYIDVYEKQYPSAIVEFTGIFQNLLSEKLRKQIDSNEIKIKRAGNKGDKNKFKQSNYELEKFLNVNSLVLKYGSFAATIVKAENSEDVKKAIEATAMPAGSSRIKRETPFNVSLNAYPGLFFGHEFISGLRDRHSFNSYGITAPVGVAVSTGLRNWSYSAFVSFIDIGTIAAFRFQNDSIDQVPSIQLKDIFSPGIFVSIGLPKCPLSINAGAQVGPNLRKVNSRDEVTGEYLNLYRNNTYWRLSLSLVVDIPLLNLYSKSK
jgi:hypothetical protein